MCSSLMTVDGSLQFSYDYKNRNWGMPLTAGAKIQHDLLSPEFATGMKRMVGPTFRDNAHCKRGSSC